MKNNLSLVNKELQKFLSSAYPHISLRVVFRPSFRLSNFFPFKDKIPGELRSHVVYLYKCQCCSALYVGQTRRHIHTRISEHMGVSPLTGKKRSVSTMSGILAHIHTTINIKFHPLILKSFPLLVLKQIYSFAKAFSYPSLILL